MASSQKAKGDDPQTVTIPIQTPKSLLYDNTKKRMANLSFGTWYGFRRIKHTTMGIPKSTVVPQSGRETHLDQRRETFYPFHSTFHSQYFDHERILQFRKWHWHSNDPHHISSRQKISGIFQKMGSFSRLIQKITPFSGFFHLPKMWTFPNNHFLDLVRKISIHWSKMNHLYGFFIFFHFFFQISFSG
jgi:hypothetical protein